MLGNVHVQTSPRALLFSAQSLFFRQLGKALHSSAVSLVDFRFNAMSKFCAKHNKVIYFMQSIPR